MMERVDQEWPRWDGDQFEVLTGEEVAGSEGSPRARSLRTGWKGLVWGVMRPVNGR